MKRLAVDEAEVILGICIIASGIIIITVILSL